MPDNVLTGKVLITAPGAEKVFDGLAKGVAKTDATLKKITPTSSAATQSLINLSRVAQDAPYGFIGIANNINPLLESFQRLKASTGTTGGALKALGKELTGGGGLGLAIGVVSSLLVVFGDKIFGTGKAAQSAKKDIDDFRDAVSAVFKNAGKEAAEVQGLITVLKSETETRERRLGAIKELQRIQPEIFKGLKLEGDAVIGLDTAYKNYIENLRTVISAKILQSKIEQIITKQLELQGATATGLAKGFNDAQKSLDSLVKSGSKKELSGGLTPEIGENTLKPFEQGLVNAKKKADKELSSLQKELTEALTQLGEVSKGIKVNIPVSSVKIQPQKVDFDFSLFKDTIKPIPIALPADVIVSIRNVFLGGTNQKKTFAEQVQDYMNAEISKNVKPLTLNFSAEYLAGQDNLKNIATAGKELGAAFSQALQTSLQDGLSAVGEGIGNILSGNDFGKQFSNVFSGLFDTIGKALIKFGIVKAGIDKILGPGGILIPGGVAIGLGVFAIAAGQLLKNISGGRAGGGPVRAGESYLVGEFGPERFTPNVGGNIQSNSAISSGRSLQGAINVVVTGKFIQSGKDMIATLTLANQSNNRLV